MAYTLSIVVPAYNEEATIATVLERIRTAELINGGRKEVLVVNDASKDGTEAAVMAYQQQHPDLNIVYRKHPVNQGKGAALHTGIREATGDYLIVQDADLEYDPHEFNLLLRPMVEGHADVVYGSRFRGHQPHRILFFWHSIGNYILTFLANMFSNLNLTDMETCYKLFRTAEIQSINLREKRFGFEPEVTIKMAKRKHLRIYEVGISYYGRTYAEGKKIGMKDAFRALWCLIKYRLVD